MKKFLAALSLAIAATASHAALISTDWNTAGDNLITLDTASGLEWLDLSQTYNQTVAAVLPQTNAGGLFEGFRLALASEVHGLMGAAGLPFNNITGTIASTAAERAAADALTALLSETVGQHFGASLHGSRGHLIDNGGDLVVGYYTTGFGSSLFNDYFAGYPTWPGVGVWLVRDSNEVPEPATLGLLGLALAGLAARKRRKA